MELQHLKENLASVPGEKDTLINYDINSFGSLGIYYKSVFRHNSLLFFIGKKETEKSLYILYDAGSKESEIFQGDIVSSGKTDLSLKKCPLNTQNRKAVQSIFPFTVASIIGLKNSFGFGDRIGLANAGHLQALSGYDFYPVLAQQSIRELTRTGRSADEVMDAAVWAVFQEGYTKGFSADGDHLKTTEDIDLMVKAGYKIFTFDPGEYVENNADVYDKEDLLKTLKDYPWDKLGDSPEDAKKRYLNGPVKINDQFTIKVEELALLKAYCKYGRSLAHVKKLYDHLKKAYADYDSEVEVSVDETDSVTSVFEHFFISNELKRLGVEFVSLAPRFVGSFEKGIDYKGDLKLFEEEYKLHAAIAEHFGNYKISLHSGSDKFSVYTVIGKLKKGFIHVKTAGTSYLEALKVVAVKQPDLFREIFDFSRGLYDDEKRTYHVSADLKKVKGGFDYKDNELPALFDSIDARQILHVTFGKVLSEKDKKGNYLFKDRIIECLKKYEETHYQILVKHFTRHLEPFK
ncbi:MAG: tagaturonate epimerase family protein [Ignavibacteriaceae bacterium]